jgi:hypothetical protein
MANVSAGNMFLKQTKHRFDKGEHANDIAHIQPYKYVTNKDYAQNNSACLPAYGANVDNYTTMDLPKINADKTDVETQLSNRCVSSQEGLGKYVNMCQPKNVLPFHICNDLHMQTNTRVNAPATQARVHTMDRTYALQKDPQIAVINEPCWIRYPANTKYETQSQLNPQRNMKLQKKITFDAVKTTIPNLDVPVITKPNFIPKANQMKTHGF